MTLAAHIHDLLRARLLVTDLDDVHSAIQKVQALTYGEDNCRVLRIENAFRPDEGHVCREVRVYMLIRCSAGESMSAVAELQIRLESEEHFWERLHTIDRAIR